MSQQFYSVKQAPLAGVVIDWYNVKLVDGTYVYMLSRTKVTAALKVHNFTATRFEAKKGWKPCEYELFSATQNSGSILKLNVVGGTNQLRP